LRELCAGMTPGLTENKLHGIMLDSTAAFINRYFQLLVNQMAANQINTPCVCHSPPEAEPRGDHGKAPRREKCKKACQIEV